MSEIKELPAVAQKVHVDCKKCGVERYHVVLSHTNATTAKLECEVCKAKRNLKLASDKPKKARASGVRKVSVKTNLAAFEELRGKISGDGAKQYKMTDTFKADTAIQHPKFGLGFITQVTAIAIEVVFEDGKRSLVHNRRV